MNKKRFLTELKRALTGLPMREVKERIGFYSEAIDDRIEEGMSEEEAVEAVGSVSAIVEQIREERGQRGGATPERSRLSGGEIALVILGSPVWIPLLAAALVLVLSMYIIIWSLVLVLWAVELPFYIMSFISKGLLVICVEATKCTSRFTKYGFKAVKKLFGGKEV